MVVLVTTHIHLVGESLHGCSVGYYCVRIIRTDLVYLNSEEGVVYLVQTVHEEHRVRRQVI